MKHTLLLGSKSASRKMLLRQANIPFVIVKQDADETVCDVGLTLPMLASRIALEKMNQIVLPEGKQEGDICFVLTADTMVQDMHGVIHGKPIDEDDAREKLRLAAEGFYVCTAFCLDRRVWKNDQWKLEERIQEAVRAEYVFVVPEKCFDEYMKKIAVFSVAGATAIEGFGSQFLKSVIGSYSAIVGIPLYELRCALERIDFFEK